jgi:5'-phosphate synthase pdxT subunit
LTVDPAAPRIGVLAIQGDYAAHAGALVDCGAIPVEVRKREELEGLHGLILPGGESTTMLKFLERGNLFDDLKKFCQMHPVFGTCAGAILLARDVRNPAQRSLGVLDAVVERNAFGRQIDSSILFAETALTGDLRWCSSARLESSKQVRRSRYWQRGTACQLWCARAS